MILEKVRKEIDIIDKELTVLFCKRLELIEKVAQYKKNNNLPIYAPNREKEVLDKNLEYIINEQYKEYITKFLLENASIAKSYQEKLINDEDKGTNNE